MRSPFACGLPLAELPQFASRAESGQETPPASPMVFTGGPRAEALTAIPLIDAWPRARGLAQADGLLN